MGAIWKVIGRESGLGRAGQLYRSQLPENLFSAALYTSRSQFTFKHFSGIGVRRSVNYVNGNGGSLLSERRGAMHGNVSIIQFRSEVLIRCMPLRQEFKSGPFPNNFAVPIYDC